MIYNSNTNNNHHIANVVPPISDEHIFTHATVIPSRLKNLSMISGDSTDGVWADTPPTYCHHPTTTKTTAIAATGSSKMTCKTHTQASSQPASTALTHQSSMMGFGSRIIAYPTTTEVKGIVQTTEDAHLSALALTRLLQGSAEEVLAFLSAEQLIELGRNVRKLKRLASSSTEVVPKKRTFSRPVAPHSNRLQEAGNALMEHSDSFENLIINAVVANNKEYDSSCAGAGSSLLRFIYSSRGTIQEYCIRADIESISVDSLPESFKLKNCVYPRAMGDRLQYRGNRYEYETSVNEIAWRLTWINLDILAGKRGLIQRAVDSYRNRFNISRSRRVLRQEKLRNGTLRRRADSTLHAHANFVAAHHEHMSAVQYSHQHHEGDASACPSHLCASQISTEHSIIPPQHTSPFSSPFPSLPPSSPASDVSILPPTCSEEHQSHVMAIQASKCEPDDNVSELSVPGIFMSNVSFYDTKGRNVILKIRLDVDSIQEDDEHHSIEDKEKNFNDAAGQMCCAMGNVGETNRQLATIPSSLKDELGRLLTKLNSSELTSNPSALRGAIDAFKYKVLTSDPLLFSPDVACRISQLKERFGSLLAPVPVKGQYRYFTSGKGNP